MDIEEVFRAAYALPRDWTRLSPGEQLRSLREARGMSQRHLAAEDDAEDLIEDGILARKDRAELGRAKRWG
jgi:hypothetical protein